MKKFIFLLLSLIFLLLPLPVFADGAGLPTYFMINGKLSHPNPLQLFGITASTFLIPEDYTPQNYLVNEPISFKIDTQLLGAVISPSELANTTFSWQFGDGTTAEGLANSHTYTHIGTYILILTINIYSQYTQIPTQFIDSFLLNVIPSSNYHDLPQAVMKVDGQTITGAGDDTLHLNLSKPLQFDASKSKGSIIEYLWDFGDGETGTKAVMTHQYTGAGFETLVLRVKDKNGFTSDTFVGLQNDPQATNAISASNNTWLFGLSIQTAVIGVIILLLLALFILFIYGRNNR